jgi:hypothetical protein
MQTSKRVLIKHIGSHRKTNTCTCQYPHLDDTSCAPIEIGFAVCNKITL